MSHNLKSLIRGSQSLRDVVSDTALKAALEKQFVEQEEAMVKQLVGVINRFSHSISDMERDTVALEKQAAQARDRFTAATEALEYFGRTGNPLPLYRSMGQVQEGTLWLQNNRLDVPCVKDRSSAWYIQSEDTTDEQGSITVA